MLKYTYEIIHSFIICVRKPTTSARDQIIIAPTVGFIDNWQTLWRRPGLLKRDEVHPSREGTARQLELRWHSTKLQVFLFAWKESLDAYKHILSSARVSYFAKLIQVNKNNSRFPFKKVAEPTNNYAATNPQIPASCSSNDFLNLFTDKIIGMRQDIHLYTSQW